ncbi:MAG: undecaprenyl-diphosphate phosphatase [Fusobacterium sp.]|nr:undecaprenyl-diphosphate phosphatase [Fusobacterium sp.]
MKILFVIILSLVEGITEFLPVSSTGHMILVEQFIRRIVNGEIFSRTFLNSFLIIVQLGAILAVVIYFWNDVSPFVKTKKEFIKRFRLWMKVLVGVIPAMILGLLFDDYIDKYFMDNVFIIATTLIFYGIILIVLEIKNKKRVPRIKSFGQLKYRVAFIIGFFQCLAMVPGTSRSGATIIGALLLGLSRTVATEFSFLLAIPTMLGATLLKLLKNGLAFSTEEWLYLGLGTFLSFVIAYVVIKWFMDFIRKRNFISFGIYRIILGILVFIFMIF